MKNMGFILILLGLFGLSSCSSVPKPVTHQFTNQTTLEASEHWGILAHDFANEIVTAMMANPLWISKDNGTGSLNTMYINPDTKASMSVVPPIYLQTNDLSQFGKTFRTYLITEITKLGYPVAHTPENAVIARWSVNKVYHKADRVASAWPGTGTAASLIGYGIYKIIDNSSTFVGVLAAGATYDIITNAFTGEYFNPSYVPHTEIVLTFTVSKDEKVLSRQTQAYYVNAKDFNHYNTIADYAGQESHLRPINFNVTNY